MVDVQEEEIISPIRQKLSITHDNKKKRSHFKYSKKQNGSDGRSRGFGAYGSGAASVASPHSLTRGLSKDGVFYSSPLLPHRI